MENNPVKHIITAGPPVMSIRDAFHSFAGGSFNYGGDPDGFGVVMPLTTALVVEQPEHVIGFAWRTVADDNVRIITFPGRDWESTAAYTGMTKDLYEANIVTKIEENFLFDNLITNPLVAYASNILKKSLMALDRNCQIIEIPRALSRSLHALLPNTVNTSRGLVDWLNTGVPLRKMKRQDAMRRPSRTTPKSWPS